jgi:hypothetical protein
MGYINMDGRGPTLRVPLKGQGLRRRGYIFMAHLPDRLHGLSLGVHRVG